MNERVGAAAVINRHFQNGETTCRQLSKRLPYNSTIFAAEATAISLALNYYQHMGPVHHDVVVYSDAADKTSATTGRINSQSNSFEPLDPILLILIIGTKNA